MKPIQPTDEALYAIEPFGPAMVLRLVSEDGTNRLTRARVRALTAAVEELAERPPSRLIITGNAHFFSAGADLNEIAALTGPEAFPFAQMGQRLMSAVARFPSPTIAAVHGYCMGGGLDLALACQRRIASPQAIFGHRGAALGGSIDARNNCEGSVSQALAIGHRENATAVSRPNNAASASGAG